MKLLPALLLLSSPGLLHGRADPADPPPSAAAAPAERAAALARLLEQASQPPSASAGRPKRRFITAQVEEPAYRAYLERWSRHIEQVGNQQYPEAARRLGLHGEVIVTVAIRRDGTLHDVQVIRSSGVDVLDQAALAISRAASPYAPLPPDPDVDILQITRTWSFREGDGGKGGGMEADE